MKTCTKCRTEKDLDDFYDQPESSPTKDGKTYWCKSCYKANYEANRPRQQASNRRAAIKRRYGITIEEYDALLAKGCGICGEKATTRIVLDHCHSTDRVREALCNNCNIMLGAAHDDVEILRQGIAYLERHASE